MVFKNINQKSNQNFCLKCLLQSFKYKRIYSSWPVLILFYCGLSLSIITCQKKDHSDASSDVYEVKEDYGATQEIFIPTIIWDLLEEKKNINSRGKIESFSGDVKRFEENVFVGLILRLKEKTPGILGGKNFEFKSKNSTGLFIDLANYIKGSKGTFIFSFEPSYTLDPVSAQVLFLSDSIARKETTVDGQGQKLGGGCGRIYEITKSYINKIKEQGIEVNVSGGRHVSLLAGTFFLRVAQELGSRALTHLTITDSKYPELLCDKIVSKE